MSKLEETTEIHIYGIVQGVGFRPFVSRFARECGLRGEVLNAGSYVKIYVQGKSPAIQEFTENLEKRAPERADIIKIEKTECLRDSYRDFCISESVHEEDVCLVSPDIAICPACKKELYDRGNRRYLHPFINCTDCGPRFTILKEMPYDRERTSMADFPMCGECRREYLSPETRRYDAQPVCCHDCGPIVYLIDREERSEEAVWQARLAVRAGKIIAVKGIGGFHLCCDAGNDSAVSYLRTVKNRKEKPLAVMMRDVDTVRRECVLTEEEARVLDGAEKPILLLKKRKENRLAYSVVKDNPNIGVMLPYSPLHLLLFDSDDGLDIGTDCLVMTSGNRAGEPISRIDEEAKRELSFCELILSHNREIQIRADDSVMALYKGEPYMIRRSRGYVPLPVTIARFAHQEDRIQILAAGADLKNSFCLAADQHFYLSPYIGDMAGRKAADVWREDVRQMEELLKIRPSYIVCDLHPQYYTAALAKEQGVDVIYVQHHFAHILSCMAENGFPERVIGAAFDGTGYGDDGTVWGGEILEVSRDSYVRLGSILPFWQTGGDLAAKEGWRVAVALIIGLWGTGAQRIVEELGLCDEKTRQIIQRQQERKVNTVKSTSAGRLFDAVSAILGICRCSTYEGEAAVKLEAAAEQYLEEYPGPEICGAVVTESRREDFVYLATDRLVEYMVKQKLKGELSGKLAYVFHVMLARQIVEGVRQASVRTGITCCALSGGVFQNKLLLTLCEDGLVKAGFRVLVHKRVPANDGGIALGQAAAAMEMLGKCRKGAYEDRGSKKDTERI